MNPTQERWLPVVGWEGLYEVSDHGNVRSVDRVIETSNGPRSYKGKMLRPASVRGAHQWVGLYRQGEIERRYIHQLVAESFIRPRNLGEYVLHSNDDALDNRVGNLRYGTHQDNIQDSVRNGRHGGTKKTHCKWGHEFTPQNTYPNGPRGRGCKRCRDRRNAEYRLRQKRAS